MTIETLNTSTDGRLTSTNRKKSSIKTANESFLKRESDFTNLKITINHWQLRDLVQSSSKHPTRVLFTCKDQIRGYDYESNKIVNYSKLDFQPRCFAELDGVIVSGGVAPSSYSPSSSLPYASPLTSRTSTVNNMKGLLNICNKELGINSTVNVGSLINNHVGIQRSSNYRYNTLVCNNDYSLYHCDLNNRGDITVMGESALGFPVNSASYSPVDKKVVVACGDSKQIVLLHEQSMSSGSAGSGSSSNPSTKPTLPSHKQTCIKTTFDTGISTLFSADGKQFCCVFQDGISLVYDIRNHRRPLHTIYSTRPKSLHGLFRCCKFSGGTDDLLFLSEHTGRVHMVDTRNYEKHQVIVLPKHIFSKPSEAVSTEDKEEGDNEAVSTEGGVYQEALVREYKSVIANLNDSLDQMTRYNIDYDYLYHSNGITSYKVPQHIHNRSSSFGAVETSNLRFRFRSPSSVDDERAAGASEGPSEAASAPTSNSFSPTSIQQTLGYYGEGGEDEEDEDACDIDYEESWGDDIDLGSPGRSPLSLSMQTLQNVANSDNLYHNSNSLFVVSRNFTGRRLSYSDIDDSDYRLRSIYEDSLVDIDGIDWYYDPSNGKSHLLVGCDKGLFRWEIDSWSRRCFPNYDIC